MLQEKKKKKKKAVKKKKESKKQGLSSGEKTLLHPEPVYFGLFLKKGKKAQFRKSQTLKRV